MIEKSVLNILPIMVLVVDEDGIVEFANPSFLKTVRNDLSNVIGQRGGDTMHCIHTKDHPLGCGSGDFCNKYCGFRINLQKTLLSKKSEDDSIEFRVNGEKDPLHFNIRTIPFLEEEKPLVAFCIDDRTKETNLQKALERAVDDLKLSNSELEQFAYVASHDLKEPLRVIAGYLDILSDEYLNDLPEEGQRYKGFIISAAERMQNQITDLLKLARVNNNKGPHKNINFKTLIDDALSNLNVLINEKSAEIKVDTMPDVLCDRGQISLLLQNLVNNSIKFSKKEVKPQIHISAKKDNGMVRFSFEDNGIGFDMKFKDKIFNIFKSLNPKKDYSGTGIGLAICKKIVESHGGKIWAESEKDKGATFLFTLPTSE